eukprot:299157_1
MDAHHSASGEHKAQSAAKAMAVAMQIRQKITQLGKNATVDQIEEAINSEKSYDEQLFINDYPQQARFKATQRTSYAHIIDHSDVTVTVRGTYFAPGRKPGPGEEKS